MKEISIGYDAKRAFYNGTGLGNYSRLVADIVAQERPDWTLTLYGPLKGIDTVPERVRPLTEYPNVRLAGPDTLLGRLMPSRWRSVSGLGRQAALDGVALFHGLSGELPPDLAGYPDVKSVVTVHDLIFRRCPENYSAIDRRIYDSKFRRAVEQATHVIAISECTRRDIIELYGADPSKISVVYQGCSPVFGEPVSCGAVESVRRHYGLPERYIISVGTIETRKNQGLAIEALSQLPPDLSLVIVGGTHGSYAGQLHKLVARHGLGHRVRFLTGVPFEHLPALYAGAIFSSYTSRYEGFGLPVVESLNVSTPVIAATGSCLEEAGGPGALYAHPDSVAEYVAHAERLLVPSERSAIASAGREYVRQFSRGNLAAGLMDAYARALGSVSNHNGTRGCILESKGQRRPRMQW